MGLRRRSVGVGTLALVLPFAGCTQLTEHETAGQVEVSVVDGDAEDVAGAPPYEESPVSEREVVAETAEATRAEYEQTDGKGTATTEVNEREFRRVAESLSESDSATGEEFGDYFAGDGVYVVVWLKQYS